MSENTLDRIKEYIDYKGLTNSSFEKSVGMSNGSFASQLKKGKTIGVDKLENILNIYDDINIEWLLTGKGEMIKTNQSNPVEKIDYFNKYVILLEENRELTKEITRLNNLIGLKVDIEFRASKPYAVAEDDSEGLVRPEKELKKDKTKGQR